MPDAFVAIRRLDRVATKSGQSALVFAKEQARYPHGATVQGLRYGTFYDRGRLGTEVEIDWYQAGHNYALSVDERRSQAPKPNQKILAAQARAVAARLRHPTRHPASK
jgi:hypothetical protein